MKTKLYICCVSLGSGGAERVLSNISMKFVEKYDEVKILTWISSSIFYEIDSRIEIIDIEKECHSYSYFKKIIWFRKYIKQNKPSVILSFLAKSSICSILSIIGLNIPIIVAERNDPRYLRGGKFMIVIRDLLYNRANCIIEQTMNNKNYFKGKKLNKTEVIYNPVHMKPEMVGISLQTIKKKKIVNVGRLFKQKNHKLLIEAFSIFNAKHPGYKLVIYGEGDERITLEKIIEDLGLQSCVKLLGNSNSIFEEIKDAELFVLSSNFEGMPNALIEAMCLGLPCISTKVSGAVDLIQDGVNGVLVDINNKNQLASAMAHLLTNSQLKYDMGKKASEIYTMLELDKISIQWISCVDKYMNCSM